MGGRGRPTENFFDALTISRLLVGKTLNGELVGVSRPFKGVANHLNSLAVDARRTAFDGFLAARDDADQIIRCLADADPEGPARSPGAEPPPEPRQWATVADIRRLMTDARWAWEGWIPSARIMGIAAQEGTGKTRLALDICRRNYLGLCWPDGQAPTLPIGTRSVWMCSDAHQDELAEILPAYAMPDDAIVFPATPDDPYGGTDLDNPDTLDALEQAIVDVKPAFAFVDTLTSATSRDLCDQRTMRPLKAALARLAQEHQVSIVLLMHLSKEGQALGRRIRGITRTLMHLECPNPEQSGRLKFWVEKSYARKPPALGVTMGDGGSTYDFDPPRSPEPSKGGRPPEKLDKAILFLAERLADGDRKGCELVNEMGGRGRRQGDDLQREASDGRGRSARRRRLRQAPGLAHGQGRGVGQQPGS